MNQSLPFYVRNLQEKNRLSIRNSPSAFGMINTKGRRAVLFLRNFLQKPALSYSTSTRQGIARSVHPYKKPPRAADRSHIWKGNPSIFQISILFPSVCKAHTQARRLNILILPPSSRMENRRDPLSPAVLLSPWIPFLRTVRALTALFRLASPPARKGSLCFSAAVPRNMVSRSTRPMQWRAVWTENAMSRF